MISFSVDGVISTSFFSYDRFGSVSAMLSCCDASKFSAIIELFQNIIWPAGILCSEPGWTGMAGGDDTDQLQRPFLALVL